MTPLLGTNISSTPVGDVPAGDNKAAQATAFQVFTRPETRDTALAWRAAQASADSEVFTKHGFFRITDFTAARTVAPTAQSQLPCSRLFTIVHDCSALFIKKYCPGPVSPLRPYRQHGLFGFHETRDTKHGFFQTRITAFVVARHGRLWRGMGGILPRASVLAPSAVPGRPHDERRSPGCSQCRERQMNPCRKGERSALRRQSEAV